jgi:hypothetical protein
MRIVGGREIRPRHMWGTREAIAGLDGGVLLEETVREVDASQVEGGFFFDIPESISLDIDDVARSSG